MRVIKGLVSLLLIAGIFGIVGLYSQMMNLGVVTTFYRSLRFQYDWLVYFYQVVLLVLLVLLLVTFFLVIFKPITKKEIQIKKEIGQINLPIHTLESIARTSLQEIVTLDNIQVKIRLTKRQMADVEIIAAAEKQQLFLSRGKEIQDKVTQALQQIAMVETNKTRVIFKKKKAESFILPMNKKTSQVI